MGCYYVIFSHFQTAGKNVVDCSEVLNPENGGSSCCLQLKDSPEKYIPKSAGRYFSSTDRGGFGWPHPQYWKQTTTFVTCLGPLETSCHVASFPPASRPYRLSTAPSPDTERWILGPDAPRQTPWVRCSVSVILQLPSRSRFTHGQHLRQRAVSCHAVPATSRVCGFAPAAVARWLFESPPASFAAPPGRVTIESWSHGLRKELTTGWI